MQGRLSAGANPTLASLTKGFVFHVKTGKTGKTYKYFVLLKEPITSENTRLVAKKIHAHHSIECSAKTGENIDKLFEMAGRAAMAHRRRRHTSRVSKWPFSHCNVL